MECSSIMIPPPVGRSLQLSQHIHVCRVNSTIIVLDLSRDKYVGLSGSAAQTLVAAIGGAAELGHDHPQNDALVSKDETVRLINTFIAQGVLTSETTQGKKATPITLDPGTARIALDPNVPLRRGIRLADVMRFLAACFSTYWLLRCGSLRTTLEALDATKRDHGRGVEFDAELAADLVAIFRRLRSFTFSAHRRCLFHAVTLTKFLSYYRVFPTFVMGVRLEPWAAHSWVQHGEFVLDGTPEQARFFKPIVAI
jgi:Transglutaminase-like superfamily